MLDMAVNFFQLLALLGGTLSIAYLLNVWNHRVRVSSLKCKNHCGELAKWPQRDSWGSELISARSAAMKQGKFFDLYRDHFREIGRRTWTDSVRGETRINTIEPLNIKQMLVEDTFIKLLGTSHAAYPFLGESILTEGPHHKLVRSLLKPAFTRAENSDGYRIRPFAERFLQILPPTGTPFDIQPILHKLYLDVATDFVFGQSIDSMGANEAGSLRFLQAFQTALKWVRIRGEAGWMAFRYNWNQEYLEACAVVHEFVDKQVAKALQKAKKSEGGLEKDNDLSILDELARHIKDPIKLRYQILGIFIPARDAGSIAMGNVLFELARHPDIWTQLREIALTVGEPSSEELRSAKFAKFRDVIYETFRHVGGARGVRTAAKDTTFPVGGGPNQDRAVFIAKGTQVAFFNKVLNLDPDHWGPDAHLFKPERFENRSGFNWDFIPFGGGRRICPAIAQSTTHLTYLMVKLLQRYEMIENHDPEFEWSEKWTMTIESRNGVKIAFR